MLAPVAHSALWAHSWALACLWFKWVPDACTIAASLSLCSVAGAQASIDVSNPQTDPRCMPISDTQSALGLQQDVNSYVWKIINPCILILTLFLLRGLVYVALRKKTSRV